MNMPAVLPDDSVESATFSVTGGRAVERLRAGQMVPWQGFIVVEGVETGDGRFVSEGALSWQNDLLPVPLMAQFENPVGGSGHDGAVLAGKIMTMTRIGNKVWATGYIDPFTPGGIRLALALDRQNMRGISVDLDSVELSEDRRSGVRNISKGRIRGATVCPFQAIVEATIELTTDEGDAMAASAGHITARVFTRAEDPVESLVASGGSSIPHEPPKSWFALPSDPNEINHPLEITADGRLSGIIASEGTCHIAFANKCEPPPKSKTNYAAFRVGSVLTAEGDTVRTGPIVMDTVHPDLRRSASDAMAFYAHTGCAVADVVPYDTQFGIYVAGVMRPDATPTQIRNLRASDISPDWRFINGHPRECCALLAVNNGGFKVPQSLAASAGEYIMPGGTAIAVNQDEEILALVASGGVRASGLTELADCGCEELNCGKPEHDDEAVEEDEKEELALAPTFLSKFGPRRFRTPKMRVFRVEQFHGNHDQSSHGNRSGRGYRPRADYDDTPDLTDQAYADAMRDSPPETRESEGYRPRADYDDTPDLTDQAYADAMREMPPEAPSGPRGYRPRADYDDTPDLTDVAFEYGGDYGAPGRAPKVSGDGKEIVAVGKQDAVRAAGLNYYNKADVAEFDRVYEQVDGGGANGYDERAGGFKYRRREGMSLSDDVVQSGDVSSVRQFHLQGQHDQSTHAPGGGGGSSSSSKPKGGGQYADVQGPSLDAQALKVKPNAIFAGSTRLQGVSGYVMDDYRAEQQGMKVDGYITIEQGRSKSRSFLKPTGKLVKSNRTRPGLVEFDQHEVDTVAEGGTIVGRPGKVVGKQYALVEMFPEIPDYLTY